jgi:hypothetical protein
MSFYTDVIAKSAKFNSVERVDDLDLLEPVTRAAVQAIVAGAKSVYGIDLIVYETYRSQARQLALFNQHASQLKVVGVHHFGLACDLVKNVGGAPSWKGDFSFLGALGRAHGLIWGGDWGHPAPPAHGFVDPDHVQRCAVARQHGLFAQTWYPDDGYDPYKDQG